MNPAGQTSSGSWIWPVVVVVGTGLFLWFAASAQQDIVRLPPGQRYPVRRNPRRKRRRYALAA